MAACYASLFNILALCSPKMGKRLACHLRESDIEQLGGGVASAVGALLKACGPRSIY